MLRLHQGHVLIVSALFKFPESQEGVIAHDGQTKTAKLDSVESLTFDREMKKQNLQ